MATLGNNDTQGFDAGIYIFKTTGALDLQWQLEAEGFSTVTNGSYSAAADGTLELPVCELKVINATTETITIKKAQRFTMEDDFNN